MPIADLTAANFDEETAKYPLTVLDFWTTWCGPCRNFAPTFEAAAAKHPDILFARINAETEIPLTQQFQIFSVPTLIAAKDDTIFYARPGALTSDQLEKLISDLREFKPS